VNLNVLAALLAAIAALELGPLSVWLDGARWPLRAPRTGVLFWQAIGISSGLAVIGSGLAVAVGRFDSDLVGGARKLFVTMFGPHPLAGIGLANALGLTLAADVAIVLGTVMIASTWRTVRSRARHRRILDLVSTRSTRIAGTSVLDHPHATAYCLPGLRSRIVVSTGAVELLEAGQLAAVIEHERGHVHEHHGLVMLTLFSWIELFRWIPYARRAPGSVRVLLEMAADDFAARHQDPQTLAAALVRMGTCVSPPFAFSAGADSVPQRVDRLVNPARGGQVTASLAGLAAAALIVLPVVLCAA
jgi:Zn-dependent protease with chaperone function